MKVAFFSEIGENKKFKRDHANARTDVAWCIALDAPMCSLSDLPDEKFDLGIVIIPKKNPNVDLDFIRKCCDNVAVMQEGPHWFFQDYQVEWQFHYYNTLMKADWIYCHNESDLRYYQGLGCKDIRVMRSLMIPEGLLPRSESGDATIIGGNFVSWYGGFDSYMVARNIGDPIYSPSMGRKQPQEDLIEDINYLNYMDWREWIDELSQFNIGVHLMRTHAAGTFAMNCAFHGIPCIGYKDSDTQRMCQPDLSVDLYDIERARILADKLSRDSDFYNYCSETALENYNKHYSEKVFIEHMTEVLNG